MADKPKEFKQEPLPDLTPLPSNIEATSDGSVLKSGVFRSPKYVKNKAGWQLDADGNADLQSVTVHGYAITTKGTFGGNGSDGELAIVSGTTTIDLGNAAVVTKNYTSISITGSGALAFSNPHAGGTIIILKSQGDVTLTSSAAPMIDASAMGAAGGAGVSQENDGNDGTVANDIIGADSSNGKKGKESGAGNAAGGVVYTTQGLYLTTANRLYRKFIGLTAGSGGGSGASGVGTGTDGAGGAGGRGGGGLYIECGGAWNFTTSAGISVKGANGSAGGTGSGANGGGGGGGGAAGFCVVLYNTLTANSGTITATGGNGGNGGDGNATATAGTGGGGGGGGGMYNAAGGAGGERTTAPGQAGNAGSAGGNGSAGGGVTAGGSGGSGGAAPSSSAGGSGGGGGTGGETLVAQNIVFG